MRTLVHLSDLHFGRTDPEIIDPLIEQVREIAPDLVVVSGDLTQRARTEQFMEARRFLDALPMPQIVVPGNHDIPLFNPYKRFVRPLKNFRRHVSDDLEPAFIDEEIAVVGINTARSMTIKDGRINQEQVDGIRNRLVGLSEQITKIVVTHHPFHLPDDFGDEDLVGGARLGMEMFAGCGADLLLAGHLHVSNADNTEVRYELNGYAALVVQAGTATSTRVRGESNSFNVIRIESASIRVERFTWIPASRGFTCEKIEVFTRVGNRWAPISNVIA